MQNSEHIESTFYPIQPAAQVATPEEKLPPAAQYPLPTWEVDWQSIHSNINLQLFAAPGFASLFDQGPSTKPTTPSVSTQLQPGSRIPLRVPQPLFLIDPS